MRSQRLYDIQNPLLLRQQHIGDGFQSFFQFGFRPVFPGCLLRSFHETYSCELRSRWTMHNCTCACGKMDSIASGKSFTQSTQAIMTSSTPRFFSSGAKLSQNFASSFFAA